MVFSGVEGGASALTDFSSPQDANRKQSNKTENVLVTPDNYQTSGQWPKVNHRVASLWHFELRLPSSYA